MGGELADDGQETIRSFNYNATFEFAVKAIQELNNIVKKQPEHKDAHKKPIDILKYRLFNASKLNHLN